MDNSNHSYSSCSSTESMNSSDDEEDKTTDTSESDRISDETDEEKSPVHCPAEQFIQSRNSPQRSSPARTYPNYQNISPTHQNPYMDNQQNSLSKQNRHEYYVEDQNTKNQQQQMRCKNHRRKSKQKSRSSNAFIDERLTEEDEDQMEDERRPNMKIREDTMDGAENPDTDPPQRRKTIEDISIVELASLRSDLPPGELLYTAYH